jgi:hypothetical protein
VLQAVFVGSLAQLRINVPLQTDPFIKRVTMQNESVGFAMQGRNSSMPLVQTHILSSAMPFSKQASSPPFYE